MLSYRKQIVSCLIIFLLVSCNQYVSTPSKYTAAIAAIKQQISSTDEVIIFPVEITRVVDGDTAEMLYHELTIDLRLKHIDAPESWGNQPYGEQAKAYLKKLIEHQVVLVKTQGDFDNYGRLIAVLYTKEGVNINQGMVKKGLAWHYKKYSHKAIYDSLQKAAKIHKRGLWKLDQPEAPWEFRKG